MLKIDFYGKEFARQEEINEFLVAVWKVFFKNINANVEFTFMDDEEIKILNGEIRDIPQITDVLSLEHQVDLKNHLKPQELPLFLGEIFLNIDCIANQAERNDHSYEREMLFLSAHALLHLLGYDHQNKDDEFIMRKKQTEIMDWFKLGR